MVAAHPDDEALGCGGTIARHSKIGDLVQVVFVADGVSSRESSSDLQSRRKSGIQASLILGAQHPIFLDFPDNQLDSVPLLEIVRKIEVEIDRFPPNIVYTHFAGDLNIDHCIVNRAVMTACRPHPKSSVQEIYSFEIPSSTGWYPNGGGSGLKFEPNLFVDISNSIEEKMSALEAYDSEMRPFPNCRSYKTVEHLASYRGSWVGMAVAEGFMIERILHLDKHQLHYRFPNGT